MRTGSKRMSWRGSRPIAREHAPCALRQRDRGSARAPRTPPSGTHRGRAHGARPARAVSVQAVESPCALTRQLLPLALAVAHTVARRSPAASSTLACHVTDSQPLTPRLAGCSTTPPGAGLAAWTLSMSAAAAGAVVRWKATSLTTVMAVEAVFCHEVVATPAAQLARSAPRPGALRIVVAPAPS